MTKEMEEKLVPLSAVKKEINDWYYKFPNSMNISSSDNIFRGRIVLVTNINELLSRIKKLGEKK